MFKFYQETVRLKKYFNTNYPYKCTNKVPVHRFYENKSTPVETLTQDQKELKKVRLCKDVELFPAGFGKA